MLGVTFRKVGILGVTLEYNITTTQRPPSNVKAMVYFRKSLTALC